MTLKYMRTMPFPYIPNPYGRIGTSCSKKRASGIENNSEDGCFMSLEALVQCFLFINFNNKRRMAYNNPLTIGRDGEGGNGVAFGAEKGVG